MESTQHFRFTHSCAKISAWKFVLSSNFLSEVWMWVDFLDLINGMYLVHFVWQSYCPEHFMCYCTVMTVWSSGWCGSNIWRWCASHFQWCGNTETAIPKCNSCTKAKCFHQRTAGYRSSVCCGSGRTQEDASLEVTNCNLWICELE
jgi:hypothetical protein